MRGVTFCCVMPFAYNLAPCRISVPRSTPACTQCLRGIIHVNAPAYGLYYTPVGAYIIQHLPVKSVGFVEQLTTDGHPPKGTGASILTWSCILCGAPPPL